MTICVKKMSVVTLGILLIVNLYGVLAGLQRNLEFREKNVFTVDPEVFMNSVSFDVLNANRIL